jgi:mRNA-degrading endonuclease RelE of RelBE toxin-antitoxin system
MDFLISDTFINSLSKLTGEEQKVAKITVFDLHLNSANSGMSFHKLEKARDKNFWSVRVSSDIRLIVHKTAASILLCYVDHHDNAYDWAVRRKLVTHPKTGAAQIVEIRETVQEIFIPKYAGVMRAVTPKQPLFAHITKDVLLSYGVPEEWLPDVQIVDEDSLLDLVGHLPSEAADALLELATGGKPQLAPPIPIDTNPFSHIDARLRFLLVQDVEMLGFMLDWAEKPKTVEEILVAPEAEQLKLLEMGLRAGRILQQTYLREIREGKREVNFIELRQLEMNIEKVEKEFLFPT